MHHLALHSWLTPVIIFEELAPSKFYLRLLYHSEIPNKRSLYNHTSIRSINLSNKACIKIMTPQRGSLIPQLLHAKPVSPAEAAAYIESAIIIIQDRNREADNREMDSI